MSGEEDCGSRRSQKSVAPPGLLFFFFVLNLGLTPQAKHLSRLRRSVQ